MRAPITITITITGKIWPDYYYYSGILRSLLLLLLLLCLKSVITITITITISNSLTTLVSMAQVYSVVESMLNFSLLNWYSGSSLEVGLFSKKDHNIS